jgi:hypothetical protein
MEASGKSDKARICSQYGSNFSAAETLHAQAHARYVLLINDAQSSEQKGKTGFYGTTPSKRLYKASKGRSVFWKTPQEACLLKAYNLQDFNQDQALSALIQEIEQQKPGNDCVVVIEKQNKKGKLRIAVVMAGFPGS